MRFKPIFVILFASIFSLPVTMTKVATANDGGDLKHLSQVKELIQHYYVREVNKDEIMAGAFKGMLQNLDSHSTFLDEKEYRKIREATAETTAGKFFGVGIEIANENGKITVVSPIEDTPAYKAGILAGDIILAIDGKPTQGLSSQEVISKIRGSKDSEVELLLLHKNSSAPSSIRIKRDSIPILTVKARFIDDGYLWVRLTRFSERTTQELHEALEKAQQQCEIRGIILDIRNNPGGLLEQAVSVADMFVDDGVIVSMRGHHPEQNKEFKASLGHNKIAKPMVVLVNSGSASASEIVAGALQDGKRAVLIGEKTFGKGSVQQIIPIAGTSTAIKLTTAYFYTPSGRSIQAEAIEPDIFIPFEMPNVATPPDVKSSMPEKDLANHLGNTSTNEGNASPKGSSIAPDVFTLLERDNQLRISFQMVRSMSVLQTLPHQK